jgi:phosphosulfolactate phosphohydrolase-like enzyme
MEERLRLVRELLSAEAELRYAADVVAAAVSIVHYLGERGELGGAAAENIAKYIGFALDTMRAAEKSLSSAAARLEALRQR